MSCGRVVFHQARLTILLPSSPHEPRRRREDRVPHTLRVIRVPRHAIQAHQRSGDIPSSDERVAAPPTLPEEIEVLLWCPLDRLFGPHDLGQRGLHGSRQGECRADLAHAHVGPGLSRVGGLLQMLHLRLWCHRLAPHQAPVQRRLLVVTQGRRRLPCSSTSPNHGTSYALT
jgi:hypothetical protein